MTSTHTIIIQVIIGLLALGNQAVNVVPDKWKPVVTGILALGAILQARLAHNWNPDGTSAKLAYVAKLLILFLLLGSTAMAQNAHGVQQPIFSVSTQALAVRLGGQTVAGADEIASFNLKGSWWLQSDNVQFSSACQSCGGLSGQLYVAGPKYYSDALAKKLGGTNLSGISPYFHAGIGVYRNAPSLGPTTQHIGAIASAGFDYHVNGTISVGPRGGVIVAPGAGPACVAAPCAGQRPWGGFASVELLAVLGRK